MDFQNIMKIQFSWRLIFKILIIHKPSQGSCVAPPKGFPRTKRHAKKGEDFLSHFEKINEAKMRKCENFGKTMSFIAATNNCSKELVEFSGLMAQIRSFII